MAHVSETYRIQVWLDQRHKEYRQHCFLSSFSSAFHDVDFILSLYVVVVLTAPCPLEKRAVFFSGYVYLMHLFEAHEFCTLIGLDWVTGPLLESGMEIDLSKMHGHWMDSGDMILQKKI